MPTDTPQQTSQQILVVSDNPYEVMRQISAAGRVGRLIFPELPSNIAEDFSARVALRQRMSAHPGPVIIDPDIRIISPAFLAFCVPTANILPV
ncbi:MAG: hypothetical protein WC451_03600 [Patescibacteria group bacterium]|jgi:hypothetical protein